MIKNLIKRYVWIIDGFLENTELIREVLKRVEPGQMRANEVDIFRETQAPLYLWQYMAVHQNSDK